VVDTLGVAFGVTAVKAGIFAGAAEAAAGRTRDLELAYKGLLGALNDEQSLLNIADGFDSVEAAATAAFDAAANGSDDAVAKARDHRQAVLASKEAVILFGRETLKLPPEKLTNILALVDEGKFDEVERRLEFLARNRQITFEATGVGRSFGGGLRSFDGGGVVPGPLGAPMVAVVHGGETIYDPRTSNNSTARAGGGTTIVNLTVQGSVTTARDLVSTVREGLLRDGRSNGTVWVLQ